MAVKPVVKSRADEAGEVPVRQRLLEAAFSALMEQGFAETSTLEIATRASASKRELCANFGSKQEILAVCIAKRAKRLRMPADLPRAARPRSAGVGADHVRKQSLAGDQQSHRDRGVPSCNRRGGPRARRRQGAERYRHRGKPHRLRELMTRSCAAALLDGEPAQMA